MNILQLATVDNGGATWFYKDALDRHSSHNCRAVRMHQGALAFPVDVLAPDRKALAKLWRWATVIHVHDDGGALIGSKWRRKPTVVTYHGTRYRHFAGQYNARAQRRGWLVTVSTLDLTEWGGEWIPTPRRDLAADWNPAEVFAACQAPTNRERKRTDVVLAAAELAGCRLELIEAVAYRVAIRRKARCACLVDGFHYGYGNNAIEAWALGMPVVAGASPEVRARMLAAWDRLPFVECEADPEALAAVLARLRDDPAFYAEAQQAGRAHYEQYHRPDRVAERLDALYRRAVEEWIPRR